MRGVQIEGRGVEEYRLKEGGGEKYRLKEGGEERNTE